MKTFSKSEKLEPTNATWLEKAREDLENLRMCRKLEHSEATWLERPKEDLIKSRKSSNLEPIEATWLEEAQASRKHFQNQASSKKFKKLAQRNGSVKLHSASLHSAPFHSEHWYAGVYVCVCGCASVSVHCSPKIHCRSPYSRRTILKKTNDILQLVLPMPTGIIHSQECANPEISQMTWHS